jgi:hypothetical protein
MQGKVITSQCLFEEFALENLVQVDSTQFLTAVCVFSHSSSFSFTWRVPQLSRHKHFSFLNFSWENEVFSFPVAS